MEINWDIVDTPAFIELVTSRLKEKSLSPAEVAKQLMMPSSLFDRFLSGRSGSLRPYRMVQLVNHLDISEGEIPLTTTQKSLPTTKGTKVFISYSHKDHEYLARLMVHLRPLEKKGLIDPWVDTRLLAGDKWKKEIEKALKSAKVCVLLISADFLASDFIIDNELPPMLTAAENNGTLIIPVILKPCRFAREKTLHEFQAINPPDEPLCLLDENDREVVYDSVAQRIEKAFRG